MTGKGYIENTYKGWRVTQKFGLLSFFITSNGLTIKQLFE